MLKASVKEAIITTAITRPLPSRWTARFKSLVVSIILAPPSRFLVRYVLYRQDTPPYLVIHAGCVAEETMRPMLRHQRFLPSLSENIDTLLVETPAGDHA
jgi:hypothetical protein